MPLTVLEAEESKIKALAQPVSGEGSLPGLQMAVFLYPLKAESREGKETLLSFLLLSLIP
jgi:hypothetical protein